MIQDSQEKIAIIEKFLDIAGIVIAIVLSYFLRFETIFSSQAGHITFLKYIQGLLFLIPSYFMIYYYTGLYTFQRKKNFFTEFFSIIRANVIGFFIYIPYLYFTKQVFVSRVLLLMFPIVNTFVLSAERFILKAVLAKLRKHGYNLKHIVIVGGGELAVKFATKIKENAALGYKIIGFVTNKKKIDQFENICILSDIDHFEQLTENLQIDEVFIALPLEEYRELKKIIHVSEYAGIKMQIIPDYDRYLPAKKAVDHLDGIPLINVRYIPLENPINATIKRTSDILFSIVALILVSPVLLVCALIIKFTSPGPIIFVQERIGRNKKPFKMYKLRSMVNQKQGDEDKLWTTKDDPRKTRFGSFMRKTSIDELPQFINVIKGDMSVIGPRPERPHFVNVFKNEVPKYMIKHHVRPGITGYAQIKGYRGDTCIKSRIEHDIFYIENWSVALDIRIVIMTIVNGLTGKHAY